MRIRKKNGEIRNNFGQLEAPPPPQGPLDAPTDIPSIVERYIGLVGKVVANLEQKADFQNRDINAVASLGRSVAMLQAVEESRIGRIGNKSITEMPTSEMRKLLAARDRVEDAEFEEESTNDET